MGRRTSRAKHTTSILNMENPPKIDWSIDIDAYAAEIAKGMDINTMRQKSETAILTGVSPAVAVTEEGKRYLENLWMERSKNIVPVMRAVEQEMPYNYADLQKWVSIGKISAKEAETAPVASEKVWALFKLRAAHISMIENSDFNWSFDENEKWIIRNMTRYFINDPACEFTGGLTKGLFLYGLPGTGKTEFMQIFERFCAENSLSKRFEFTSMSETYVKAKSDKQFDPIAKNVQLHRCFDEFGRHTGAVVSFGESLDINEAIIEARYTRFRHSGQKTHIVANMAPNECKEVFTPMIFDRIKQMCSSVHFTGQSKRK